MLGLLNNFFQFYCKILFISTLLFSVKGHSSIPSDSIWLPNSLSMLIAATPFIGYNLIRNALIKPKCEINIEPDNTYDLLKKNNQYTGCLLKLTGSYVIDQTLVLRNILISSETGAQDGESKYIGIPIVSHQEGPIGRPVVATELFSALEIAPQVPAKLVLKGDSASPLILEAASAINGVAVDSSELNQDYPGCMPTGFIYRRRNNIKSFDLVYLDVNFLNLQCLTHNHDTSAREAAATPKKSVGGNEEYGLTRTRKKNNDYKGRNSRKSGGETRETVNKNPDYRVGHVVSIPAGAGGDDRDNNKRNRNRLIQDLVQIIQKISTAQINEDEKSVIDYKSQFSSLWIAADKSVQNLFRERYSNLLEFKGLSDLIK